MPANFSPSPATRGKLAAPGEHPICYAAFEARARAVVLAVFVLTLVGCSSSLQSEVVIHAPRERVWSVLTAEAGATQSR